MKLADSLTASHDHIHWIAKPLALISIKSYPIALASNILGRDPWKFALENRYLHVIKDEDGVFSFKISLNMDQKYEIRNNSNNVIYICKESEGTIKKIGDILEHLAMFAMVRDLHNRAPHDRFLHSFQVHIIHEGGKRGPDDLIEVKHEEKMELIAENRGNTELYFYIYNLGPHWQIENMLRGSYEAIPSCRQGRGFTGISKKRLKMVVPLEMREKGLTQCEDIIKVILTSQPASFDIFDLPKLGDSSTERNKTPRKSVV
jgi:hypothetical protein